MLCGLFLGFGHLKKEPPLSLHGLASHRGRASLIDLIRDCGYFSDFSGMYLSACVGNFPVKEACPCFFLGTRNSLFPSGVYLYSTGVFPVLYVLWHSLLFSGAPNLAPKLCHHYSQCFKSGKT